MGTCGPLELAALLGWTNVTLLGLKNMGRLIFHGWERNHPFSAALLCRGGVPRHVGNTKYK